MPTTCKALIVYLSDLNWLSAVNGHGPVELDTSNGEAAAGDGQTITLNGVAYGKGIGAHANSEIVYDLGGEYSSFVADVGLDDEVGSNGTVIFRVNADGELLYDSGVMTGNSPTRSTNVSVAGMQQLRLVVDSAAITTSGITPTGPARAWCVETPECKSSVKLKWPPHMNRVRRSF